MIPLVTVAIALLILLAYAGLMPLGTWRDEFLELSVQRQQGFAALLGRLAQWSPRPFSELAIYVYGTAVEHFGTPLIAKAIAPFWLLLVAALVVPVWRNRLGLLAAMTLLAMLLLGHPVAEVFYWPFAVFAYMPTVAAAGLLVALDWGGHMETRSGRVAAMIALTIAAGSSEVGALFVALYVALYITFLAKSYPRYAWLLGIPLLLALWVLHTEFAGRVALKAEVFGDPQTAHHPLMVLRALGKYLFFQLFKGDNAEQMHRSLNTGVATKLAFFAGIYFVASSFGRRPAWHPSQRMRLILCAAALATAVLTLAASFYNFGSACCERHDTTRQAYMFVALASLATFLARWRPARSAAPGAPLLLFAILIPLWTAAPKLLHDYRSYTLMLDARRSNWASGHAAGPAMQWAQAYPGEIVGGTPFPPQLYQRTSSIKGMMDWVLLYHGKQRATIQPPVGSP